MQSQRVTVSNVAVALNAAGQNGVRLIVTNQHATDSVDLGSSAVTAANGYELKAGKTVEVPLGPGERLWAIRTAATDVRVDVIRQGV